MPQENRKIQETQVDDCTNHWDSDDSKNVQSGSITTREAFWNICNTIQGLPILSIPYVIQCGGLVSIITLIIVACISCYTSALTVKCLYEKTEDGRLIRVRSSFVDVGKAVWKQGGAQLVLVTQLMELILISSLYPLIVGSILDRLFVHLGLHLRIWILVGGVAFLPNICLANLSQVAWTSVVVIGSAVVIFTSFIIYGLAHHKAWRLEALVAFNGDTYPEAVMWLVASYFSQPFVTVIEESMTHRRKFNIILFLSFFVMTLINMLMGVIASLTFFPRTEKVITSNLPDSAFKTIVNLMAAILSFTSFTLPVFTIFEMLEHFYVVDFKAERKSLKCPASLRQTVFYRLLIVGTAVVLATVPKFPHLVAFIGSLTGTSLEVIFPTLFHIKLCHSRMTIWQIIIDAVILTFGIAMVAFGLYFSARTLTKTSNVMNIPPSLDHGNYKQP